MTNEQKYLATFVRMGLEVTCEHDTLLQQRTLRALAPDGMVIAQVSVAMDAMVADIKPLDLIAEEQLEALLCACNSVRESIAKHSAEKKAVDGAIAELPVLPEG